jgi:acyl-CoA reductase-like NAD-dependent aldehyde dehydrogenase
MDTKLMNKTFKMLINGNLESGENYIEVINPATGQVFAQAPDCSDAQLQKATSSAESAFPAWSRLSYAQRGEVLTAIADIIEQNKDELIELLVLEQGKPRAVADVELSGTTNGLRNTAKLELAPEIVKDDDESLVEVHYRPLGVAAGIVPWNYPLGIGIMKLSAPLIAGCTLVLKPSPYTPLSMLRLGELIQEVAPKGVINIISGADSLGEKLTSDPKISKISFTGSTATGKKVMAGAAQKINRVTLELGGNDAAIVLKDSDITKVATSIFMSAFLNSGQTCIAIKRLYVHESQYEEMLTALAGIASLTKVGPGIDPESHLGPIQNKMQYEKVKQVLAEVKQGEGRIVCGGDVSDEPGYFIPPTIVADVKEGCSLVDEETFGPILPVIKYSDVDDAISRANDSIYGLGGSIWGNDIAKATELACRMNTGTCWVNQHMQFGTSAPFGGAKHSGIGAENGAEGLKSYTQAHVVNVSRK